MQFKGTENYAVFKADHICSPKPNVKMFFSISQPNL